MRCNRRGGVRTSTLPLSFVLEANSVVDATAEEEAGVSVALDIDADSVINAAGSSFRGDAAAEGASSKRIAALIRSAMIFQRDKCKRGIEDEAIRRERKPLPFLKVKACNVAHTFRHPRGAS